MAEVVPFGGNYDALAKLVGTPADKLLADDLAEAERMPTRWFTQKNGELVAAAALTPWPNGEYWVEFFGEWDDIGAVQLLEAAVAEAQQRGIPEIWVGSASEKGNAWNTAQGFQKRREVALQRCQLPELDLVTITAPVPEGLRLASLADLAEDSERDRKVYKLEQKLHQQIPGSENWNWSFEDFWHNNMGSEAYDPNLYLVLIDQTSGDYVGLHRIWLNPEEPRIGMTAVLPEWRRCGGALAMKTEGMRRLVARGFATVRTENDSDNEPILRLNARLGFTPSEEISSFWSLALEETP
ncbi:MAG: hypothetical protein QM758_01645 [Armatimonas sp.]